MSCESIRESLHDWFDQPGSPSLPPEVAEHVKECPDCRSFATKWNRIEHQLIAMREEGPDLSPDFAESLQARLKEKRRRITFRIPAHSLRFATMSAAAVVVLVAAFYILSGLKIIPQDSLAAFLGFSHR